MRYKNVSWTDWELEDEDFFGWVEFIANTKGVYCPENKHYRIPSNGYLQAAVLVEEEDGSPTDGDDDEV